MSVKLLFADDSVTMQKVIQLTLENEDMELLFASNGEDALKTARSKLPDIIIADISMPAMDGFELCAEIRKTPETASIPLILISGELEHYDSGRGKAVGASGHITKPFKSEEFISMVREYTENPPLPEPPADELSALDMKSASASLLELSPSDETGSDLESGLGDEFEIVGDDFDLDDIGPADADADALSDMENSPLSSLELISDLPEEPALGDEEQKEDYEVPLSDELPEPGDTEITSSLKHATEGIEYAPEPLEGVGETKDSIDESEMESSPVYDSAISDEDDLQVEDSDITISLENTDGKNEMNRIEDFAPSEERLKSEPEIDSTEDMLADILSEDDALEQAHADMAEAANELLENVTGKTEEDDFGGFDTKIAEKGGEIPHDDSHEKEYSPEETRNESHTDTYPAGRHAPKPLDDIFRDSVERAVHSFMEKQAEPIFEEALFRALDRHVKLLIESQIEEAFRDKMGAMIGQSFQKALPNVLEAVEKITSQITPRIAEEMIKIAIEQIKKGD